MVKIQRIGQSAAKFLNPLYKGMEKVQRLDRRGLEEIGNL